MNNSSIHKDRWYLDVRGQVVGPKTTWSIICDLTEGKLKVIHRVSKDNRHWKAICNEPYFEKIIKDLIASMSAEATKFAPENGSDKNEVSGFHNLSNVSAGISEQLEHANKLQELNVGIGNLRQLLSEINSKKKMVIGAKNSQVDEVHPDDADEFIGGGKKSIFPAISKKRLLQISVSAVVVLGVYVSVMTYLEKQHERDVEAAEAKVQEALREKALGNYEKALQSFETIKNNPSLDADTLLEMAEAHIHTRQFDQGNQLAQSALKVSMTGAQRARANSMLGAVALHNNDLDAAADLYEKSLKEEEGLFSSLHNLAIIYLNKNEPEPAEALLLKAVQMPDEKEKGPTLLALFEAAWQLDLRPDPAPVQATATTVPAPRFQRLTKIKELLNQYETKTPEYSEEFLVAKIVIASAMGDKEQFQALTEKLMTFDSKTTPPKKFFINMDYERSSWSHIYNWCFKLYSEDRGNDYKNAFFASCVQKSKSAQEALPYAQYANKISPDNVAIKNYLSGLTTQLAASAVPTPGAVSASGGTAAANAAPASTRTPTAEKR